MISFLYNPDGRSSLYVDPQISSQIGLPRAPVLNPLRTQGSPDARRKLTEPTTPPFLSEGTSKLHTASMHLFTMIFSLLLDHYPSCLVNTTPDPSSPAISTLTCQKGALFVIPISLALIHRFSAQVPLLPVRLPFWYHPAIQSCQRLPDKSASFKRSSAL